MLIADTMVSVDNHVETVELSNGDIFEGGLEFRPPKRMANKVFIISDSIAITCSGNEFDIKKIIEDLRFNADTFDLSEDPDESIGKLADPYNDKIQYLIWRVKVVDTSIKSQLIFNVPTDNLENLGEIAAIGSGREQMIDMMRHWNHAIDPTAGYGTVFLDILNFANGRAFTRNMQLNYRSHNHDWGGYFSGLYFDAENARWSKPDSCVHFFSNIDDVYSENPEIRLNRMIIGYDPGQSGKMILAFLKDKNWIAIIYIFYDFSNEECISNLEDWYGWNPKNGHLLMRTIHRGVGITTGKTFDSYERDMFS
ncbi:hypothetical protein [Novosphingobium sp. EMRT-2]|uniref:hypothetical protein n=1 Tax=Novosphingobium sp. EMRT-2 TaxID=2571749 RepID=UPI0010BE0861|nr:hypothetical protein [Novosphingobium sp. EMRT-2]QCI92422.1 hypothetical protein FA702_01835 [Novosphingobium sp. EMRT-2]